MTRVSVCRAGHAIFFDPQPRQRPEWVWVLSRGLFRPEACDLAFTAWREHKVAAMAGIVRRDDGTARAWALFSRNPGPAMLTVVRLMKRVVAQYPASRLEMHVEPDFGPGARLAKLVGMIRDADAPREAGWHDRPVDVYVRAQSDGRRDIHSG